MKFHAKRYQFLILIVLFVILGIGTYSFKKTVTRSKNLTSEVLQKGKKEREKYRFIQNDWFDHNIDSWRKKCKDYPKKPKKILEIGSFEGASTTWILDNLLLHPESRLTAIDTFAGSMELITPSARKFYKMDTLEDRFWSNINKCDQKYKLNFIKDFSSNALYNLRKTDMNSFDHVYIDGSHTAADVMIDAIAVWPLLKKGGILVFDDYEWDMMKEEYNRPKLAIDSFIAIFRPKLKLIELSNQAWLEKVEE